jgi:uncharacterized FAD-dependent dehydrogenase
MSVLVHSIRLPLDAPEEEAVRKAAELLKDCKNEILSANVYKKSVDARHKRVCFVYSVLLSLDGDEERIVQNLRLPNVLYKEKTKFQPVPGKKALRERPVVCGFGPAGIFAAFILASFGYRPLVFERGDEISLRDKKVSAFWNCGGLDAESNVQFGEGGAGAIPTEAYDPDQRPLCDFVLETLKEFGAGEDVVKLSRPHIGTDLLKTVIFNIRQRIIALGGEIRFSDKIIDLVVENGKLAGIQTTGSGFVGTNALILAAGHSARDTFEMLFRRGLLIEPKAFSAGVRCEHRKEDIDSALLGDAAALIGAAEYQLSARFPERTCYTFCMCPGGSVIASSSDEGGVVVNGMSEHARNQINSNCAVVVNVKPSDFRKAGRWAASGLKGIWSGGRFPSAADYGAPVQRFSDFVRGEKSLRREKFLLPIPADRVFDLNLLLPSFYLGTYQGGFASFERQIGGFSHPDTMLTGVETRTSSPVRI